ncbi:hypothetical protein QMK17_25740 [Rhodococcus sp. G-MC3]|uniref:hypothetical protein n=1 Tax=Rhodococcus sp. G-MC3 TaxID=3046209 RepID=UPI0024BA92B0|nr:hypothetical protein [Rhodococcus sp. G-MC3]MDJ0396697.1 hypothetical protein [Rhodococcus sp. G-MC3]
MNTARLASAVSSAVRRPHVPCPHAPSGYLAAIARSGTDTPRTVALAEALGSNPQSDAPQRDSCIRKGLAWPPARGLVAFTVPGRADFIRRQPNRPDPLT